MNKAKNKVCSMEEKPGIFDDFDDTIDYPEISLEEA
jgi:hypothetical protein